MPKISVLTPLYNTEPDQLKEMIESVLAQSFSDFEFLLLNDSPDNTELESRLITVFRETLGLTLQIEALSWEEVLNAFAPPPLSLCRRCDEYLSECDGIPKGMALSSSVSMGEHPAGGMA